MKRKLLSITLIVMLIFTFMPVNAFAAEDSGLKVDVAVATVNDVEPGTENVAVEVSVGQNPGIKGFQFTVAYDETKLTLVNGEISANFDSETRVKGNEILGLAKNPVSEDGTIVTLYFNVNKDAEGSCAVSLENPKFSDKAGKKIAVNLTNGAINVVNAPQPTEYAVTVEGGKATPADKAAEGTVVTVEADVPENQKFVEWTTTSEGVTFEDAKAAKTTFTMPSHDVAVKANFEPNPTPAKEYTVTVKNGTVNGEATATVKAGTLVTVKADNPETFANWTSDNAKVVFDNDTHPTTTFTMPESNVTVTANAKAPVAKVTVSFDANGGNGDMAAEEVTKGAEYTLPACKFTAPDKKAFKAWEVVGVVGEYKVGDKITVTDNITVKAVWQDVTPDTKYTINVTNGAAKVDGVVVNEAKAGDLVTVTANIRSGYTFKEWKANKTTVEFKDKNNRETTFVMPAEAVSVEATYSSNGGSTGGGGGGVYVGPSTTVTKTIVLTIDSKIAKVDSNSVVTDVPPIIVNSRTYTPSRFVAEQLGATVDWNEAKQLVTVTSKDKKTVVELTIGSSNAKVNGKTVAMDAAAFIQNGRTYTPSRFVAEQLGAKVVWSEANRQVTITQTVASK